MIIITAQWKAKEGQSETLKKHLVKMVENVRENEPDCLEYILQQSQNDPSTFLFYEQYTTAAAFESHKQTMHFKALIANTANLIDGDVKVETFNLIA